MPLTISSLRERRLVLLLSLVPAVAAAAPAALLDLPVVGHGAAVVSAPSPEPRPVLVATHGSFDRPDWHCETWRAVFGERLVVLCPRGTLRWDTPPEPALRRYYYQGHGALDREIDAALAALRARMPGRLDSGPLLYLGFSQGAIYGVALLQRFAARFPRAILIEGGTAWSDAAARQYAKNGGRRVLFACGQAGCAARARAAAAVLTRAGVAARVVSAPGTGHTYDGQVMEQIRAAAGWILEPL